MEKLILKFKRLSENVKLPTKAHSTDACYDIYAPQDITLDPHKMTKVEFEFAVECPQGYKLCLYSRSGLASKGIILSNSVGIVDPDYRGPCGVYLLNSNCREYKIKKGDRIMQCSLEKIIPFEIEETDELSETERGSGGFGSSGK